MVGDWLVDYNSEFHLLYSVPKSFYRRINGCRQKIALHLAMNALHEPRLHWNQSTVTLRQKIDYVDDKTLGNNKN